MLLSGGIHYFQKNTTPFKQLTAADIPSPSIILPVKLLPANATGALETIILSK
jgi:hypothetical protein